jgi:uncharacterized membrane protein
MKKRVEKEITTVFEIGVIIKSVQGIFEIIAGVLLLSLNTEALGQRIEIYAQGELVENSHDIIFNFVQYVGQHISSSNFFLVAYLLGHGLVKLFLVIGLFHKKLWAYYVFIWILGVFICYEAYRLSFSHSVALLIFTLFDILLLYLTWMESKILKSHLKKQAVLKPSL